MDRSYRDKVALVTGAGSGIGLALSEELARRGAHVLLSGRDLDRMKAHAQRIGDDGGSAIAVRVDVMQRDEVQQLVDIALAEHGKVDYLFNVAGKGLLGEVHEMDLDHWQRIIQTNLMGVVHGVDAVYPVMVRQRSGHIVNVSSLAGLLPTPSSVPYVTSKYAVVGLSHALRIDAAQHGVRVSVVCPAAVDTPIFATSEYVNIDSSRLGEVIPGATMTPATCARAILRGVERNRETIVPGPASLMWRLYRYFPALWGLATRVMAKKMGRIRTLPPPSPHADGDLVHVAPLRAIREQPGERVS